MDVGSPYWTRGDASMLILDDIKLMDAPNSVSGNVIDDPNEYLDGTDPLGASDEIKADGGKVTQIAFEADHASSFIDENGLGALGAYADSVTTVIIPVPDDGSDVFIPTPLGATLLINEDGEYTYYAATEIEEPEIEEFVYTLTDWDGSFDTAILAIDTLAEELSMIKGSSYDIDYDVFDIHLDDMPYKSLINGVESGDMLNFHDVLDVDEPFGEEGQPDLEDVIDAWVQHGEDDVIVKLQNNSLLMLNGIGMVPVHGPHANQDLISHLDTLGIDLNVNPMA
jgi:hypothetical protein